jgi:hypothetical protein
LLSLQQEEDISVIAIRRGVTTTIRFRGGLGASETLHILLERGK